MNLEISRENFLPSEIKECMETKDMWPKGQCRYFINGHGFDTTGCYYTIFYNSEERHFSFLIAYHYDQKTNQFAVKKIRIFKSWNRLCVKYHPETVRWFEFEEKAPNKLKLYSGSMLKYLSTKSGQTNTFSLDDARDSLLNLSWSQELSFVKCEFQKASYCGKEHFILIVLMRIEPEDEFLVDIIDIQKHKILHLKRLQPIKFPTMFFELEFASICVDLDSQRMFLHDLFDRIFYGFNFEGHCLVSHVFINNEKRQFAVEKLFHVSNSTFLIIIQKPLRWQ